MSTDGRDKEPIGFICPSCMVPLGVETTRRKPDNKVCRIRVCPCCGFTMQTTEKPVFETPKKKTSTNGHFPMLDGKSDIPTPAKSGISI